MKKNNADHQFEDPCDAISVTKVDHVQDFGVLIAIEKGLNRITHVSDNIEKSFGIPVEKVLGQSIVAFADHPQLATIAKQMARINSGTYSLEMTSCAPEYELVCHEQHTHLIFEWVFFHKKDEDKMLINYGKIALFFCEIRKKGFNHALQEMCKGLKTLLSFDKVLIYHFKAGEHGQVLAEAREEEMDEYLNLRFPASDVPLQVRKSYMLNRLRIIHDAKVGPVKIHTIPDQQILDLTQCLLKGIAPIHQEYVQAMKLSTSISYAIKSEGKLWGLLCLHHRTAKELCHQERVMLGLVGQLIEVSLSVQKNEKRVLFCSLAKKTLFKIAEEYAKSNRDLTEIFIELSDNILKLLEIEGCCISFNKKIKFKGKTPEPNFVEGLINWLSTIMLKDRFFSTECLAENYPEAKEYAHSASGILAFSIGPDPTDMIICFRPDQISYVLWGGNPDRTLMMDKALLNPERSFARWREDVSGRSNRWRSCEIAAAQEIKTFMKTVIIELLNARMSKELKSLNKQKDSFLQMAAHDLRNPLTAILGAVTILRSENTTPEVALRLEEIIQRQGQSMLELLNELLDASVIESLVLQIKPEKTNLPVLFQDIIAFNTILFEKKGVKFETSFQFYSDDVVLDKNKIKQVVENLLSNALKYSKSGTTVTMFVQATKETLSVVVKDQGIGIPESEHGLVFVPLSKLSPKPTGGEKSHSIGLSICKKFIDAYGGEIGFSSTPGVGSTFYFTVPLVPPSK